MKIDVKNQPKSEILLTIELTDKELDKYKQQAVKTLSEKIKISGFRPGKVPADVMEKTIGKEKITQETLRYALPQSYFEAIKEKKIEVISRPEVKVLTEEPLKYEAKVAVLPEVTVKEINSIKVAKKEVKVAEKDVKEAIEQLQKSFAVFKDHKRAVKKGDRVELDFCGYDEKGEKIPNTESKNHPVVIGDKTFIPGFEEELIGLKKDEKKEFSLTFPKDYHKEDFQGKKVKFKVEVKRTEESILPELNEEFITKVTNGKKMTFKEFEKEVKDNLEKRQHQDLKTARENEFLGKLIEKSTLEVPEILVNEEIDFMIKDIKMDLAKKGMQFEDYLKAVKKKEEDLRKEMGKEAEKRVKLRIVLNHVFIEEKIEPNESEIEKHIEEILKYYPKESQAQAKEVYKKGQQQYVQVVNKLKLDKLFEKYL